MNKTKFSLEKAIKAVEISSRIEGHFTVNASLSTQNSASKKTIQATKEIKDISSKQSEHRPNDSGFNKK